MPPALDEAAVKTEARARGEDAAAAALRLAEAKAAQSSRPGAVTIGADQILVCDGAWFDKPAGLADAAAQLRRLRGRAHRLVTGCAVLRDGAVVFRHVAEPCLTMRDFSDSFLDAYLAQEGEAVLHSVGAYRLEGPGIQLFSAIEGEYGAILGLPMLPLLGFLRGCGIIGS